MEIKLDNGIGTVVINMDTSKMLAVTVSDITELLNAAKRTLTEITKEENNGNSTAKPARD